MISNPSPLLDDNENEEEDLAPDSNLQAVHLWNVQMEDAESAASTKFERARLASELSLIAAALDPPFCPDNIIPSTPDAILPVSTDRNSLWARTRIGHLNKRMRRRVIIEIYQGSHTIHQWSCADVLRAVMAYGIRNPSEEEEYDDEQQKVEFERKFIPDDVQGHFKARKLRSQTSSSAGGAESPSRREINRRTKSPHRDLVTGVLTYRDLRQVFTAETHQQMPSIEVRRGCVLLCLSPLTAIILHDRVFLLVNEDLQMDSLIRGLKQLTDIHASHVSYSTQAQTPSNSNSSDTDDIPPPPKSPISIIPWEQKASMRPVSGVDSLTSTSPHSRIQTRQEPSAERGKTVEGNKNGKIQKLKSYGLPKRRQSLAGALDLSKIQKAVEPALCLFYRPQDEEASEAEFCKKRTLLHHFPFEFAALETLVTTTFEQLNLDIRQLESTLNALRNKVQRKSPSTLDLEALHWLKEPIELYRTRVKYFDKAFDELLGDAEDMKRMELTRYFHHPELYRIQRRHEPPNPDLEILLEYFDQEIDQFSSRVKHLTQSVDNAERLISLRLAVARNRLIQWDLSATLVGVGIALGTAVSGIMGMNLRNGLEESHTAFLVTASTIGSFTIGVALLVVLVVTKSRL